MDNKSKDVDLIAFHINNAVQIGNSKAATEEAEEISKRFILIRREDLPKGETRFNIKRGENVQHFRSTHFGGLKSSTYFDRALDLLAAAQHAEEVEKAKERDRLIQRQNDAWKMLNPNSRFDYTVLLPSEQAQVDVVVGLLDEIDSLKKNQ